MQKSGPFYEEEGTATPGTPVIVEMPVAGDVSSAVFPPAGGSALVESSISPLAVIQAGNGRWFPWTAGTVTVNTQDLAIGPVRALRFTATTHPFVYDVLCRPTGSN